MKYSVGDKFGQIEEDMMAYNLCQLLCFHRNRWKMSMLFTNWRIDLEYHFYDSLNRMQTVLCKNINKHKQLWG